MKNILITGGAGFVGSNLAIFLKGKIKGSCIVCLDSLARSGSAFNVSRLNDSGIEFIKGDISALSDLNQIGDVDLIIDCCAESSVLASYADPSNAVNVNLMGTFNCLELAKKNKAALIYLSSSRV